MLRYLDEFAYSFNRRWRQTAGFALTRAVRVHPLPYCHPTAALLEYVGEFFY